MFCNLINFLKLFNSKYKFSFMNTVQEKRNVLIFQASISHLLSVYHYIKTHSWWKVRKMLRNTANSWHSFKISIFIVCSVSRKPQTLTLKLFLYFAGLLIAVEKFPQLFYASWTHTCCLSHSLNQLSLITRSYSTFWYHRRHNFWDTLWRIFTLWLADGVHLYSAWWNIKKEFLARLKKVRMTTWRCVVWA